jgi:hypothetical protein
VGRAWAQAAGAGRQGIGRRRGLGGRASAGAGRHSTHHRRRPRRAASTQAIARVERGARVTLFWDQQPTLSAGGRAALAHEDNHRRQPRHQAQGRCIMRCLRALLLHPGLQASGSRCAGCNGTGSCRKLAPRPPPFAGIGRGRGSRQVLTLGTDSGRGQARWRQRRGLAVTQARQQALGQQHVHKFCAMQGMHEAAERAGPPQSFTYVGTREVVGHFCDGLMIPGFDCRLSIIHHMASMRRGQQQVACGEGNSRLHAVH